MYEALRNALFRTDPERAHHLALAAMAPVQRSGILQAALRAPAPSPRLRSHFLGHTVDAPLGMAAGFDKEAAAYNALFALGFGHVEVGTVTPRGQPGNDKPRVQRLPEYQALVNRMGFPGPGAEAIAARLARRPARRLLGANVGPNKDTGSGHVGEDVRQAAMAVAPYVDFLTLNVSSPNTPGLRDLQTPEGVATLVGCVAQGADDANSPRPVLLKLHPDAPDAELVAVARAAVDAGAVGVIAVNTTRARPDDAGPTMDGGLSGRPLLDRAVAVVAALHRGLKAEVPIIGVGGIFSGDDALRHVQAGASLVQTYTGFIYRGPRTPAKVHAEMMAGLDRLGMDRLDEAIGTA